MNNELQIGDQLTFACDGCCGTDLNTGQLNIPSTNTVALAQRGEFVEFPGTSKLVYNVVHIRDFYDFNPLRKRLEYDLELATFGPWPEVSIPYHKTPEKKFKFGPQTWLQKNMTDPAMVGFEKI